MVCRVKWGDKFSDSFNVPLGTKQGGVSSPKFFALYVDDLVKRLRNSGWGCHMQGPTEGGTSSTEWRGPGPRGPRTWDPLGPLLGSPWLWLKAHGVFVTFRLKKL